MSLTTRGPLLDTVDTQTHQLIHGEIFNPPGLYLLNLQKQLRQLYS
jgi:hypothetical protein